MVRQGVDRLINHIHSIRAGMKSRETLIEVRSDSDQSSYLGIGEKKRKFAGFCFMEND
jgi:hypothetical protein